MRAFLQRSYERFRGIDPPERIVPAMDGPLHPNAMLDEAPVLLEQEGIDNLCVAPAGVFASAASELLSLMPEGEGFRAQPLETFARPITCIASDGAGALAIGQDGEGILIRGGAHDGMALTGTGATRFACPTGCVFVDPHTLIVAIGSDEHVAAEWKRDLMKQCHSGSVWRIDLGKGAEAAVPLAKGLAFPSGLALGRQGELFVSEAWEHRVVGLSASEPSAPVELLIELPAYPGFVAPTSDGAFWLALFAPRNPLVEFVILERRYCERMIDTVDPQFWIAPALSSGKSFLEPIQGGARKKLNVLKPWSPSWSYGLALQCNAQFRPVASVHSRADGNVHGVTSLAEKDGRLMIGACGSGRVVAVPVNAQIGIGVEL
ncbi:strictosidine synthase [Afifella sp. IM 167]|uniref:strictosidine synthase n=1 Tax=Afifella sp. IM 167 TaxID=2033586 RepID=UPI001CCDDB66|nr:strictosidine synthase [Afifella sp. IM 167]MBZ8135122.1 strictosidine synthase [Afifella sp. IM 167]